MKTKSAEEWAEELNEISTQRRIWPSDIEAIRDEALREAASVAANTMWGYDGDCGIEQTILSLISSKETK